MPDLCYEIKIKEKLMNILKKDLVATHCTLVLNTILDMTTQIYLIQWCNFINKILNGTIEEVEKNFIIYQAERCAMRYQKKKKSKNN